MPKPQIIFSDVEFGVNNSNIEAARSRLLTGNTYKDCSTICLIPTRGYIHSRVIQSHYGIITPMNQKFTRIYMTAMEVGDAYNNAIEVVLNEPSLRDWKYVLTLEDDNCPQPDGLIKLIESIEGGVDGKKYDVMGGLYFCKGEMGAAMIYGDPAVMPRNFIPQVPQINAIQSCNGLGMGFTLFRLDIFKDPRFQKPYFKTVQTYEPGKGVTGFTQDLWNNSKILDLGYKIACDTRVKVGHWDADNDILW